MKFYYMYCQFITRAKPNHSYYSKELDETNNTRKNHQKHSLRQHTILNINIFQYNNRHNNFEHSNHYYEQTNNKMSFATQLWNEHIEELTIKNNFRTDLI